MRATVLSSALGLLLAASAHGQTTWYVDANATAPGNGTSSSPYARIQDAIDAATTLDGDTILVAPGTYPENVVLDGRQLTLRSTQGAAATRIDGQRAGRTLEILNSGALSSLIEGFTITGGSAQSGAGVLVDGAGATIADCVIAGNQATQGGGGILVNIAFQDVLLLRCTITDNDGGFFAGGVSTFYAFSLTLDRCSITNNRASSAGAGLTVTAVSDVTLRNTVVWGNVGPQQLVVQGGLLTATYCDIAGGYAGTGNIDLDPLFWNAAAGNVFLQPLSPCIDAGDPNSPLDPDGTRADIGAEPFDPQACGPSGIYCVAKVNSQGCTPSVSTSGMPSATSTSAFSIDAANLVNNKSATLIYGYDWNVAPFLGGFLCIAPPVRRTLLLFTGGNPPPNDCSGSLSFDFNAWARSGQDPNLNAGTTVYAQFWSRDKLSSHGSNLTDAARFTLCP